MKSRKGITLVALIITIAILIIITAVSIFAFSDSGLIGKAKEAKTKGEIAKEEEKLTNIVLSSILEGNGIITEDKLSEKLKKEYGEENYKLYKYNSEEKYILKLEKLKRCYEIEGNGKVGYIESRLPFEYQEVEYLESTGTQYIDMGITANSKDLIDVTCMITGGNNNQQMIFGGRQDVYSLRQVMGCLHLNGRFSYFAWGKNVEISNIIPNLNMKYSIKILEDNLYINDVNYYTYTKHFQGDTTMYLFNMNGDTQIRPFYGRIYYFKILNKINLIPCYRRIDNKPGMYDLVTNTFYTNQGTGEFIIGPDVN